MARDYYPLVRRAVTALGPDAKEKDRRQLYGRLLLAQAAELKKLGAPKPEFDDERRALSTATNRIELDTKNMRRLKKKGSTLLLSLSLLFPGLWMLDPTSMSIYWVARFPQRTVPR